jgi:hypothetical protein
MTIVKHVVMALFGAIFTFGILAFWAIASDMARKENAQPVAISDMLAEAAAGRVDEITVRGTRYEYRLRGSDKTKVAYGPKTTAAELGPFAGSAKIDVK